MATAWNQFIARRVPALVARGWDAEEAQEHARGEYHELKERGKLDDYLRGELLLQEGLEDKADSSESTLEGLEVTNLRFEMPYMLEAKPNLAAAWDVAEGLVDFLIENAQGLDEQQVYRRKAAAAYERAHGMRSRSDQTEYALGQDLGEALVLVMAHRGLTRQGWTALAPRQLGGAPGVQVMPVGEPVAFEAPRRLPSNSSGPVLDMLREAGRPVGRVAARGAGEVSRQAASERFGPALGEAFGAAVEGTANTIVDLFTEVPTEGSQ